MRLLFTLFLASSIVLTTGCAWLSTEDEDETKNWSADRFYSEAKDALSSGNYTTAIDLLDKLQARYPFGRYAQQAHLEQVFAYHKDGEPDLAIASADRFIRTHPRHPFVDYAYYVKGLANYDRGVGLLQKLFPGDSTKTDTRSARQSFNDFSELVRKFPESRYAEDASRRMLFLRNNLAAYEVNVAGFYYRRQAYVAAANRAKFVLENFASAPAVTDALGLMTKAYLKLGMKSLAADSTRVLQQNYPDSHQYAEASALLAGREAPERENEGWTILGYDLF